MSASTPSQSNRMASSRCCFGVGGVAVDDDANANDDSAGMRRGAEAKSATSLPAIPIERRGWEGPNAAAAGVMSSTSNIWRFVIFFVFVS